MATTAKKKTTINFTPDEEAMLQELVSKISARTKTEAVRRSLIQASLLHRYADDEGFVTIQTESGETVKFPTRW